MVGDTPWDAQACVAAGVACIGVRSGGNDSATLRAAGAREVREDLADVLADL
jgi:phosphoglycolate phosphatase-like HAD superfamily hydrolase